MWSAVILLTVFIGIAEMCGNVHQTGGTISSPSSPQLYDATVKFQTNKSNGNEIDKSKIETNEYKALLKNVTPDEDPVGGKIVLTYTFKDVNCDAVKAFAKAAKKDYGGVITGGSVDCNDHTDLSDL